MVPKYYFTGLVMQLKYCCRYHNDPRDRLNYACGVNIYTAELVEVRRKVSDYLVCVVRPVVNR